MKHLYLLSFIIILLIFTKDILAQTNDFGTRIDADLKKKLTKKIDIEFNEELRMNNNSSTFDRSMTTLGASYDFNKTFKTGVFYTYIYLNNQKDGYWEGRNRFGAWITAGHKFNRLRISLREKYHSTYRDEALGNFSYNPKSVLRSRIELTYNIKKLPVDPYISAEMQYQLNNPEGNAIDRWKYTAGAEYKISKKFSVDLYFRLDKSVNVKNPATLSVLGTSFSFQL
jgi:hypothetical protein